MSYFRIIDVSKNDPAWQFIRRHSPQTVGYSENESDACYFFFAATDSSDECLGLCVIEVGPMPFGPLAGEVTAWLEDILVLEAHRRRGIATALMHAALRRAWSQGARHMQWTVPYENLTAIAFYRKMGALFIPEEDPSSPNPERYYTAIMPNACMPPKPTAGK